MIETEDRLINIASTYDKFSATYDNVIHEKINTATQILTNGYDFSGSTLDLGCGTGIVGKAILAKEPKAHITGIDISPKMVKQAKGYLNLHVGCVEKLVMKLDEKYDHVISSGLFPFIDSTNFVKILNRSFQLARKSVSFTIEEYPEEYNQILIKLGLSHMLTTNHVDDVEKLKIPPGWALMNRQEVFETRDFGLVKKERVLDFAIPTLQVSQIILRYEKEIGGIDANNN